MKELAPQQAGRSAGPAGRVVLMRDFSQDSVGTMWQGGVKLGCVAQKQEGTRTVQIMALGCSVSGKGIVPLLSFSPTL